MFCAYCLGVFLKAKYTEARFQVFDKARAYKKSLPCLQSCLQVEDKPSFREVWQRAEAEKVQKTFSTASPLKFRTSYTKEHSIVNPMIEHEVEMIANPLSNRKRGRTMDILAKINNKQSQQVRRFHEVSKRLKRLRELDALRRTHKTISIGCGWYKTAIGSKT